MTYSKFTKISPDIERSLANIVTAYPLVTPIVNAIDQAGGMVLLVGGAVRDLFLNLPVKDLDCEIHDLPLETIEKILGTFGTVMQVGKTYGVLRIAHLDIDWSMPRTDEQGRKPTVHIDPYLSLHDAFKRRDLTMNAMGIDLKKHTLIDPFDGLNDLQNRTLRTPDTTLFVQDPLRFYRVMQFISRFDMYPDDQLQKLCSTMDISNISRERIVTEFEKLLLKSAQPSLGIRWLKTIGRLAEIMPELAATIGIEQSSMYHPEGDVFEHTMQAVDAAAENDYQSEQEKLTILCAVLCHDLGKVSTTKVIKDKITSYGHEIAGVPLATKLLERIGFPNWLVAIVQKPVRHHMAPPLFARQKASLAAYKRLAKKLYPQTTLLLLAAVARADHRGRNGAGLKPLAQAPAEIEVFLTRAQQAGVVSSPEPALMQGKDLMEFMQPGPAMGDVLDELYRIQIEEGIIDKEILKERAKKLARK